MRDYQKLKELTDYTYLDMPCHVGKPTGIVMENTTEDLHCLRVLVKPKYGNLVMPSKLTFLSNIIRYLASYDYDLTGIEDKWCYVTVRHGLARSPQDNAWHFDGASFREETIPERNYIWCDHSPTEYKVGPLEIPSTFDPLKHDLFDFAEKQLHEYPIETILPRMWYMLTPFVFHRCPVLPLGSVRTFYRISFPDIEIRDKNNTPNPWLPTEAFGRDPVKTFRNKLVSYYNPQDITKT